MSKESSERIEHKHSNENPARISELEREIQKLRLEIEEKDRELTVVQHELAVQIKVAKTHSDTNVRTQLERLFSDVGAPLVQLVTQDHLTNVEGKTLQPKDLLAVGNRIVSCLKNHGLQLVGSIGQNSVFDPAVHDPISVDDKISSGDKVTVRMVGISYNGKILRRAAVTRAD